MAVDYSKFQNLDSDIDSDEEVHPNIDKKSWLRLRREQRRLEKQRKAERLREIESMGCPPEMEEERAALADELCPRVKEKTSSEAISKPIDIDYTEHLLYLLEHNTVSDFNAYIESNLLCLESFEEVTLLSLSQNIKDGNDNGARLLSKIALYLKYARLHGKEFMRRLAEGLQKESYMTSFEEECECHFQDCKRVIAEMSSEESQNKGRRCFQNKARMRNSIKVLCLHSEAGTHSVLYKECMLTENVRSMLFPIHNESFNIEILSTPHSIYSPNYYNRVDLYAYSQGGNVFFSLTPLALETDVVAISGLFFGRLKEFINTYFEHEICRLDAICAREDKKYFYLAGFYFKHNFYDKALFFADRALKSGKLEDPEIASMLENKTHIQFLQKKNVDNVKVVNVINLYGHKTEDVLCFIAEIESHIDTASLVFLTKLVDPKSLRYLERIYFFYKCARIFSDRGKRRLAIANYVNAYFSIQDGYNIDTKVRLYERSLDCVERNWKPVIASVIEKVACNEEEELKILMRKDGYMNLCHRTEYSAAEHGEYFTFRVESFDNIVCFSERGALYAGSGTFDDNSVYYTEFVRMAVVSKIKDLELLQIGGCLLDAGQHTVADSKEDIDIFKTVKRGVSTINIHCPRSVCLRHIKFRAGDSHFVTAVKDIRLIRMRPVFTYRITEMTCMHHELRLGFEVMAGENRRPKIFCPENAAQVLFGDSNRHFSVVVVEKHLRSEPIHILCELDRGVYKKYIFRRDGRRYTAR
ncbi:UNVERIFIED_CONTAM: hypothetical protein PYX00_011619 [Menopon gallinae]|uniref:Cdc37 N-terminal domain-containing protein n=1 Tax=Menopon gallinae TaxID=328185 RepID=A0AAW2H8A4_9NEOP